MKSLLVFSLLTFISPTVLAQTTPAPVTQENAEKAESGWQWGVGVGASTDTKWKFDEGMSQGELRYNNALALSLELRNQEANSWGFQVGTTYEFERTLKTGSLTFANVTTNLPTNNPPSIQMTVVYINGVYQWDHFYLPFGLNWTFVELTDSASIGGGSHHDSGLGAQLGFGWAFSQNIAAELLARTLTADAIFYTTSGQPILFQGHISSAVWTLKYFF